jgi:thiamine transport system permease protein
LRLPGAGDLDVGPAAPGPEPALVGTAPDGFGERPRRLAAGVGHGLFLLFRPVVDQSWIAYGLVVAMNAIMALPFGLRTLSQAVADAAREDDRLCGALGLSGWNRWRLIDWPKLRRPLGVCLALAFSLALGDLSAIALFGRDGMETLPLLLYQQMGAYHMPDANVTAALLLILNFACYAAIAAGVGGRARR